MSLNKIIAPDTAFKWPFYLPVLLIIAVALFVRLHDITLIGVGGNDIILYYSLAEQWRHGNFVFRIGDSTQVFRPVLLGMNALALSIFGDQDYAIKVANVFLDTANLKVYLGDNVIHRIDHANQSLEEVVADHSVKWVVFTMESGRPLSLLISRSPSEWILALRKLSTKCYQNTWE